MKEGEGWLREDREGESVHFETSVSERGRGGDYRWLLLEERAERKEHVEGGG